MDFSYKERRKKPNGKCLLKKLFRTWWHFLIIPALKKTRQEDHCEFEASQGYVRPCLAKRRKKKEEEETQERSCPPWKSVEVGVLLDLGFEG